MNSGIINPSNSVETTLQLNDKKEDITVPDNVYFCQVSESLSCGACCGLYNLGNFSRDAMVTTLEKRSYDFAGIPREVSEIIRFGEMVCRRTHQDQPFPEFHHCPYVGLIGKEQTRVGCMLHPMAKGNNGVDFRGLSYYGGMACRIYFCPAGKHLPDRIKNIVRACFDDWYEYGLIITEIDLIAAIFQEIEIRLGTPLFLEMISPEALLKIYQLLILKLNWPYRNPEWTIVNYFFEDRKYIPPVIKYHKIQVNPSRYHAIFQKLGSTFSCAESMYQAESILNRHFDVVIEHMSPVKSLPSC
jgi:hypothetical protein